MMQIVSVDAVNKSGLSFDNLKSYASATGLLAAGMIVAHAGLKLLKKQDNILVSLGLTAIGVAGAMYIKNPWVKLAFIGVAAYGAINTISVAAKEVTKPANTGAGGLSGFIPETMKEKIRNWVPAFGSVGEWESTNGYGNVNDPNDPIGELDEPINGYQDPVDGPGEEEKLRGNEELLSGPQTLMM